VRAAHRRAELSFTPELSRLVEAIQEIKVQVNAYAAADSIFSTGAIRQTRTNSHL
jgi:hypothetical protein